MNIGDCEALEAAMTKEEIANAVEIATQECKDADHFECETSPVYPALLALAEENKRLREALEWRAQYYRRDCTGYMSYIVAAQHIEAILADAAPKAQS